MGLGRLHAARIARALQDKGLTEDLTCPACERRVPVNGWAIHRRACTGSLTPAKVEALVDDGTWAVSAQDLTAAKKAYALALIAEAPNASPPVRAIARHFTEVYQAARQGEQLPPAEAFRRAAAEIRPPTSPSSFFAEDQQA